jgi:hypothetical protein
MDAYEPRVRRRGFFLHSDTTGEPDTGEHENPEGFVVRVRIARPRRGRQISAVRGASGTRSSDGRARSEAVDSDDLPQIRSGSVTGSRQREHSPR